MAAQNWIAVLMFFVLITWKIAAMKQEEFSDISSDDARGLEQVLKDLKNLLEVNVVTDNGLFDGIGSIDVAVYKRSPIQNNTRQITRLFLKSFGKSQVSNVATKASKIQGYTPLEGLKKIASTSFPKKPDVLGSNTADKRNQYRIASNTKTFIGVAANLLASNHGLDLDEKIHPKWMNLSTLGSAHSWNKPNTLNGYPANFPDASQYTEKITFRHLLTHTSGLSRESKKDGIYAYASSRTNTERCPPSDVYQGTIPCDQNRDQNWRAWTQHISSYMMPSCGYAHYNEVSKAQNSCLPGEYFHYSNAGYSILSLALDNYLKTLNVTSTTIEDWITVNVFRPLNMTDTVFTWVDYTEEQKQRTVHGCQDGVEFETCNQSRVLTDYSDRGIKTPPGGIWSTTTDVVQYLLNLNTVLPQNSTEGIFTLDPNFSPAVDEESEEDHSQMPQFEYGHGWYIAEQYSCLSDQQSHRFIGAWGTVPGFTSYMITNPTLQENGTQYAIVMLRSYNYAGRFNLGNQARRFLWRLLHPNVPIERLECPVTVLDDFSEGDKISEIHKKPSSALCLYASTILLISLLVLWLF